MVASVRSPRARVYCFMSSGSVFSWWCRLWWRHKRSTGKNRSHEHRSSFELRSHAIIAIEISRIYLVT